MRPITLFLLLVSVVTASAQLKDFSITGGITYPYIKSKMETTTFTGVPTTGYGQYYVSSYSFKESYEVQPGLQLGGRMDMSLTQRFFLTTGISVSWLRYKQSALILLPQETQLTPIYEYPTLPIIDNIYDTPDDDKIGKTSAWYLQVPLSVGTTLLKNNRLAIQAGFMFSIVLDARTYTRKFSYVPSVTPTQQPGYIFYYPYQIEVNVVRENVTDSFTQVRAGGMISIAYKITERVNVNVSGQPDFTPLYKEGMGAKPVTFALGGSYYFK